MSSFRPAHGITTLNVAVGTSGVVGVTMSPNVVWSKFRMASGSSLIYGAIGLAHASMVAAGNNCLTYPTSLPPVFIDLNGPSGVQFTAVGATAIVQVLKGLGEGYSGQY